MKPGRTYNARAADGNCRDSRTPAAAKQKGTSAWRAGGRAAPAKSPPSGAAAPGRNALHKSWERQQQPRFGPAVRVEEPPAVSHAGPAAHHM